MQNKITSQSSSFFTIVLLIVLSLIPLIISYRYPAFLNDDSFITLTYAKNLAAGNGFVFNHPPAVLGTTTPLLTIFIAGLALVIPQIDIPVIAVFLTAICWLGIPWTFFFFRIEWGLENWQVCILALVLIGSGWVSFLGMEAYLFAFLLILAISLFFSEHYLLTGLTAGLLFLTRGEGVFVLVVLMIAITLQDWVRKRSINVALLRTIAKLAIGFAIPIFIWAIFAHFTFGFVLPNTLATKQAYIQHGFGQSLLHRLTTEWIPGWGNTFAFEAMPFVNFWWIVVIIGFIDVLVRKRRWLILLGWVTLYIIGYTLLNVSSAWWYQLPILFVLNLFFALGIITIVEILTRKLKHRNLALGISFLITILLIFLLSLPTFNTILDYQGDSRGQSYAALSQWFRKNTKPSESLAFIEIGYLGYYTDNRIIDLAGLVLPDIVPHIAEGDFEWGFWSYQPDYYVYLPDFDWALGDIRADSQFSQKYQPVATLDGPWQTDFIIYKRNSR
ncbi:MAG: hypothetical protein AMJ56_04365 [Anaerolineae bacterium SG8_19]|jgi:arabinofuranosyltransferase|nr:MAG: hypothetical protein AMJ56_04365 [Anaerolineae bacterium SG8_19]